VERQWIGPVHFGEEQRVGVTPLLSVDTLHNANDTSVMVIVKEPLKHEVTAEAGSTDPELLFREAKRRERRRRLQTIGILVLLLGVAVTIIEMVAVDHGRPTPAGRRSPTGQSRAVPSPRCVNAQLDLHLINTGNGGGNVIWVGTFVNQSAHACLLAKGSPGLKMLGPGNVPISATVTTAPDTVPTDIDLGHGEAASFVMQVSDGGQSLPSLPACPAATSIEVTPPGLENGITIVAPPGLIAYPYDKGGPCGSVSMGVLIAGAAPRATCPACYPPPAPGESVASNVTNPSRHESSGD